MKKLLVLLTALCLSMSAILFGMGCDSTKKHDHTAAAEWQTSETQHWHECTFDGCKEKLDLANHTYDQEVATDEYKKSDATDTAPATYYKSCVCGVKGTETFTKGNAKGHTYPTEVEDSAWTWTATETGYTATLALNCVNGDDVQNVTATVVLSDDEDKTYPADCTYEGLNTYVATAEFNGKTYTAEKEVTLAVDPDAHDTKTFALEPATCFNEGHKAYEYCLSCKKYFEKGSDNKLTETTLEALTLTKLEHDFENGTHHDAVASTCIATGNVAYNECKNNCGTFAVKENDAWEIKTEEEVILAKADHNYDIDEDAFRCAVCNEQRTFVKKVPQIIIPAAAKGDFTMKFTVSMNVASVDEATWAFRMDVGVLQAENTKLTIYGDGHMYASAGYNTYNSTPYYFRNTRDPLVPDCKSLTSEYTITRTGKFYTFYILTTYVDAEGVQTVVSSLSAGSPSSDAETLILAADISRDVTPVFSGYSFANTAYDLLGEVTANDLGLDGTVVNVTEAKNGAPSQDSNYVGEAGLDLGYVPVGGKLELVFNNKRTTAGDNNWQNYITYLYNADANATLVGGSGTHNGTGNATNALLRERGNNGETWKKGTHAHNGMFNPGAGCVGTGIFCYNPGSDGYNTPMGNSTVSITIYRVSKDVVYTYTTLTGENLNMVGSSLLYLPDFVEGGVNKLGVALNSRGATLTITSAKLYLDGTHAHTYTEVAEKTATCTATGVKAHYICNECGLNFVKEGDNYVQAPANDLVIAKLAHSYGDYVSVDANQHKQVCSVCGDEKFGDHVKGDDELCEYCGYDMSCKHENVELVSAKAATCTEDGNEAYYKCADCGKLFSDEAHENAIDAPVVIKALGHTYSLEEDMFHCAVCHEERTEYKTANKWNYFALATDDTAENFTMKFTVNTKSTNDSVLGQQESFSLRMPVILGTATSGAQYDTKDGVCYDFHNSNWDSRLFSSPQYNTYNALSYGFRSARDIKFSAKEYNTDVTIIKTGKLYTFYLISSYTDSEGNTVYVPSYTGGQVSSSKMALIFYKSGKPSTLTVSDYSYTTEKLAIMDGTFTSNDVVTAGSTVTVTEAKNGAPSQDSNYVGEAGLDLGYVPVGGKLELVFNNKRTTAGDNNWQNYITYLYNADANATLVGGSGNSGAANATNAIFRERGNNGETWKKGIHTHNGMANNYTAGCGTVCDNPGGDKYNTPMSNSTVKTTIYRVNKDLVYVYTTLTGENLNMQALSVIYLPDFVEGGVNKLGVALNSRGATLTIESAKLYTPVTEA